MEFDDGRHDLGDEYVTWLKEHGPEILSAHDGGDTLASNIIRLYTMYSNRPEHIAAALLEMSVDEFRKRQ